MLKKDNRFKINKALPEACKIYSSVCPKNTIADILLMNISIIVNIREILLKGLKLQKEDVK